MKRSEKSDGRRRLRLERETLRSLAGHALSDDDLLQVAGGAVPKQSRCCTTWLI